MKCTNPDDDQEKLWRRLKSSTANVVGDFILPEKCISKLNRHSDEIHEMFYHKGYGATRIAYELGLKSLRGVTTVIALGILGFGTWEEYHKKHGIVHSQIQQKKRREAGFTEKLKKEVKSRDKGKCVRCYSRKNLCVHHKDGDFTNNELENLETLCRKCHILVHRHIRLVHRHIRGKRRVPRKRKVRVSKERKARALREINSHPSLKKRGYSICSICGEHLANDKAVERHIKNYH